MPSLVATVFIKFMADPKNIGRICDVAREMPNIEFPTMGGHVFWDTLAVEQGYKLQRNKFTNHCRILDPDDNRIAWGAEAALSRKLNAASGQRKAASDETVNETEM